MGIQGVGNYFSNPLASEDGRSSGGNSSAAGSEGAGLLKKSSLSANMALQLIQSAAQSPSSGSTIDVYA